MENVDIVKLLKFFLIRQETKNTIFVGLIFV